MIMCFELSMPNIGSWNGKWSGSNNVYAVIRFTDNKNVYLPKRGESKSWDYNWDDGWSARVTARAIYAKEKEKIKNISKGFCGYEWMVDSIIRSGKIECTTIKN
jgi:hypothetical protein